jgi:hypothetical protein
MVQGRNAAHEREDAAGQELQSQFSFHQNSVNPGPKCAPHYARRFESGQIEFQCFATSAVEKMDLRQAVVSAVQLH